MYHSTRDQDAQMLSQIKALPEGDMKKSLLESFLKTMTAGQKQSNPESSHKAGIKPLFLEASFEINTRSFIKHNKETKLQHPSLMDLAKEVFYLKKEVVELKLKMKQYEEVSEDSYKVDSWARQEIKALKDQVESLPPPLEDVPIEHVSTL